MPLLLDEALNRLHDKSIPHIPHFHANRFPCVQLLLVVTMGVHTPDIRSPRSLLLLYIPVLSDQMDNALLA
ncbi:MAG: hypothetical protein Q8L37_02760 [Candidatus Gottesmanbacteria bacterium]|nr:hypothetical protein [Candidatus Gottesmanbacteria bacterium]